MRRYLRRLPFATVWCLVAYSLWSGVKAAMLLEDSWARRFAYRVLLSVDPELARSNSPYWHPVVGVEHPLDRSLNIVFQNGLHVFAYASVLYFTFALITLSVAWLPRRQRLAPLLSLCTSVAVVWTCQWASVWLIREQLEILR